MKVIVIVIINAQFCVLLQASFFGLNITQTVLASNCLRQAFHGCKTLLAQVHFCKYICSVALSLMAQKCLN